MKKFFKDIAVALKGFGMGAANVVPGVSGGTIALITGIYRELVAALDSCMSPSTWKLFVQGRFRDFWVAVHGRFLLALAVGVLLSILSLAKLMEYVMLCYPVQTWGFFFGMIAASAAVMAIGIKNWKFPDFVWLVLGGILGVLLCTLSPANTTEDLWFIFVCGALAICTMILPGISGSFVLLILGKYDYIMSAVNDMNLPVLCVFALGCVVGILSFSKFLNWLLGKCGRQTMLVLLGFVLGSLVKVWPWNDISALVKAELIEKMLADGKTDLGTVSSCAEAAIDNFISAGVPMESLVSDFHVWGASLWAFAGVAFVWILEVLSRRLSPSS